jgi:hypothetical protein
VTRLLWLVCGIFFLVNPHALLAQRRGGRGQGAGRPPTGVPDTDDSTGFKRAIELQATPDQVVQFRQLTDSTQIARKRAQDLLQLAEDARERALLDSMNPLTSAVEEAEANIAQLLRGFSAAQKSGLKPFTKKLEKANSDVTRQSKALTLGLGHAGIESKQIAGVVEKLDRALGAFQTEQLALGNEMGIQESRGSQ